MKNYPILYRINNEWLDRTQKGKNMEQALKDAKKIIRKEHNLSEDEHISISIYNPDHINGVS